MNGKLQYTYKQFTVFFQVVLEVYIPKMWIISERPIEENNCKNNQCQFCKVLRLNLYSNPTAECLYVGYIDM